jgi:hypothetical protein
MKTTLKTLPPEERAFVKRDILDLRAGGASWQAIRQHLLVGYGLSIGHAAMRRMASEA